MRKLLPRPVLSGGICSLLALAAMAAFASPAMAATPEGRTFGDPGVFPDRTTAIVQGTLTSANDSTITIAVRSALSDNLSIGSSTNVTIVYQKSRPNAIEGLTLSRWGQPGGISWPQPSGVLWSEPDNNSASVQGTLADVSNKEITITVGKVPSEVDLSKGPSTDVTIVYEKSRPYAVEGLTLSRPSLPSGTPWPPQTETSLASVQGTLTSANASGITIDVASVPSVNLSIGSSTNVTIVYEKSSPYAVEGLTLNRSAPPSSIPWPPRDDSNFASVRGTLTSANDSVVTISVGSAPSVNLSIGSSTNVTIVYEKRSPYAIEDLTLIPSSRPSGTPWPQTADKSAIVQGTLTSANDSVVTIAVGSVPSEVHLSIGSSANVTIVYEKSSPNAIEELTLSRRGEPSGTPWPQPADRSAIVQGTLTSANDSEIIIDVGSVPSEVDLSKGSSANVTIVYQKNGSPNAIEELTLSRSDEPSHEVNKGNDRKTSGGFASFFREGMNWMRIHIRW